MNILLWSLPLFQVRGITIRAHATFPLLLLWFASAGYNSDGWLGASWAVGLVGAVFTCVVLHELGHCLVAQRYGVAVHDIILLPIGGVASLRTIPEEPEKELAITIAGPLVNAIIATLLLLIGILYPWVFPDPHPDVLGNRFPNTVAELGGWILLANVVMIVFNLIPAFPMDGGRIFRALLVRWLGYVGATRVASYTSQVIGVFFGALGVLELDQFGMQAFLLCVIGMLLFFTARAERNMVRIRSVLRGATVSDVMGKEFVSFSPSDRIGVCWEKIVRTSQEDFPVLYDDELRGVLEGQRLQDAFRQNDADALVGDVMTTSFPTLAPDANLADAYSLMQNEQWSGVPVLSSGELIGWLTRDNIHRYCDFPRGSAAGN